MTRQIRLRLSIIQCQFSLEWSTQIYEREMPLNKALFHWLYQSEIPMILPLHLRIYWGVLK